MRGIDKFTNYVGQPIYEDFKKKLKLDDSLFPVYNSANDDVYTILYLSYYFQKKTYTS